MPGDSPVSEPGEEDEADVLRRQFQHLVTVAGVALLRPALPGPGKPGRRVRRWPCPGGSGELTSR
ncbi:MAG: hypothetical protein ACRDRP_17055 [Pseudonocardiaceae bacterium]